MSETEKQRKKKININSYASRIFRDTADQDYLAARACYKNGLVIQFLWMGQQAIEKYLKAIILYNGESTKSVGHNLIKALNKIRNINGLELDISESVLNFIEYLNNQGVNRYIEKNHYAFGNEILKLDRAVWEIRRYCKVLNYDLKMENGLVKNMMKLEIENIHKWKNSDKPYKFYLVGGFLEKILKNKKYRQRNILIWSNFYYGLKKKNEVSIPSNSGFINAEHFIHPENFPDYNEVIHFTKEVKDYFLNGSTEK